MLAPSLSLLNINHSVSHNNKTKQRSKSSLVLVKTSIEEEKDSFEHKYNLKHLKEKWNRKIPMNFSFYDTKFPKECVQKSIRTIKEGIKIKTTPDILGLRKKEWNSSVLVKQSRFDLFSNKSIFDLKGYMPERISLSCDKDKAKKDSSVKEEGKMKNMGNEHITKPIITQSDFLHQIYGVINREGMLIKEKDKDNYSENESKRTNSHRGVSPKKSGYSRSATICYREPVKIDPIEKKKKKSIISIPIRNPLLSNDHTANFQSVINNEKLQKAEIPIQASDSPVKPTTTTNNNSSNSNNKSNKKPKVKGKVNNKIQRPPKPILMPQKSKSKEKQIEPNRVEIIDNWRKKSSFQKEIEDKLFQMEHKISYYHPGIYVSII